MTNEEIIEKVLKESYMMKTEGHFSTIDLQKALYLQKEEFEKMIDEYKKLRLYRSKSCQLLSRQLLTKIKEMGN